jgi:DNA invertase Pin-like site-specific DNA recombinase
MARPRKSQPGPKTFVVGYIRVSSRDQVDSGLGLAAQRTAIDAECANRGWTLVAIEADEGKSGKSVKNRPGLAAALRRIETGEAGTLLSAKLDRLSRSVLDFAGIIERANRAGWCLRVLDVDVDTSTPNGQLVATVLAAVAQWERQLIAARTSDALAVLRAQGRELGRPSPVTPDVIARVVELRAEGRSWAAIASVMTAEHCPTASGGRWHPTTVRRIALGAAVIDPTSTVDGGDDDSPRLPIAGTA